MIMIRFRRSIKPSIRALAAHRTRALLALASVSVGVAAVVATNAIGIGAEQQIVKRIESAGSNLLVVRPAQVNKLTARMYGVNWRMVLAVASLLAFALAGSADDPSPY